MEMREYLDTLESQIRSKKAKAAVREELRAHIEDQAQACMEAGMEERAAYSEAVRRMGDPVEVGVDMDRIHRPRNNWKLLGVIAGLSLIGLLVQYLCIYRVGAGGPSGAGPHLSAFFAQCVYTLTGVAVMTVLYLCDYSLLGRYGRVAGALFIVGLAVFCIPAPVVMGGHSYLKTIQYFFIPIYGGILYEYRGRGVWGYVCAILWLVAAYWLGIYMIGGGLGITMHVLVVCAVLLAVTMAQNWYGIGRRRAPVLVTAVSVAAAGGFLAMNVRPYQVARLKAALNPWLHSREAGFQTVAVREINGSLRLLGEMTGGNGGGNMPVNRLPGVQSDYVILQVASMWGILAAVFLAVLLVLLLAALAVMVRRQKNRLGQIIGLGCVLILAFETAQNLLCNLGYNLTATAGLPFFTFGKVHTIAVYGLFGILLSIYRYKDLVWDTGGGKSGDRNGAPRIGKFRIRIERVDA